MKLVTVATHESGYFKYLKESCERYQAQLDVLGWGQKWQGFAWRLKLMLDYLDELQDNEIVCFIDSFDVILLRPLDELETFFKNFSSSTGVKIVVGCDKPNTFFKLVYHMIFYTCNEKPLNAGTYIGYCKDIKNMLNDIWKSSKGPKDDDQVIMGKYCINKSKLHEEMLHIDCDSVFFWTRLNTFGHFMTNQSYIKDGYLYYNGLKPFFAHGNGNTYMWDLIRGLGYEFTEEDEELTRKNTYYMMMKKLPHYLMHLIWIILLACILIVLIIIWKKTTKSKCYIV